MFLKPVQRSGTLSCGAASAEIIFQHSKNYNENAKDHNDPTLNTRLDMRQTRFRKIEASRNEISKQNRQRIRSAVAQDRKKTRYGYRLDHRTENKNFKRCDRRFRNVHQNFNAGIRVLMVHILPIIHDNAWTAQMIDIVAPDNHCKALRIKANAR
ncbi:hypothetical protein J6590_078263 [Homalodisca vitripennis]|nr:hypothetical protein J6590_078263 [Homalodisca vitripennis]